MMKQLERITIRPEVCLGQPAIRGTRITVSVLLRMLAGGKSIEDVLNAYPELDREDVQQAMLALRRNLLRGHWHQDWADLF
jgi:uncharacterized protein (DUF433 family)